MKTAARVVTVCEICMFTAVINCGRGNVDVDRLLFHAAIIDVVRLALCTRVTMETECERTRCCVAVLCQKPGLSLGFL